MRVKFVALLLESNKSAKPAVFVVRFIHTLKVNVVRLPLLPGVRVK